MNPKLEEVEVASEMINAGVHALAGFFPDSAVGEYAEMAVTAVWKAMAKEYARELFATRKTLIETQERLIEANAKLIAKDEIIFEMRKKSLTSFTE